MRALYSVTLLLLFGICLVCGLIMYALCTRRTYRKYMTRCRLRTTYDVVSRWLGDAPDKNASAVENAPALPYVRLLLLDDQHRCWMDTLMPHLALNSGGSERPGPPLDLRNNYDVARDPMRQLVDVATRASEGGFVEYENDLGEHKEWVYAFARRLPQNPRFVLCVEWMTAMGGH